MLLADIGVLIYFIHHIAKSIQLPEVIAGIARDLARAIDAEFPTAGPAPGDGQNVDGLTGLQGVLESKGVAVPAGVTGYLQFVGYAPLVAIAEDTDAVMKLAYRPGHFVVAGRPLALVWPPEAAPRVASALARAHVTGPHRTLVQDPVFAIDQLVEIAIRALSPAVNDTFTALTCIDWLCDGLCKVSGRVIADRVYRDRAGRVRLIEPGASYARMVDRAFDKIRQAGRGMPAVSIRLLEALARVVDYTTTSDQRGALVRQADMVLRSSEEAVPEELDRAAVRARHADVVAALARAEAVEGTDPAVYPAGPDRFGSSRSR
jgi:uncharacterized membrane protein